MGRAVADAEVQQIELGVPGHRVPHRAATPIAPPFATPGGQRELLQRAVGGGAIGAVGGIAGYGVEAPAQGAGGYVIGRDEAAHAVFGAAVADHHHVAHHARRAGDGVGGGGVEGARRPQLAPVVPVQGLQATVYGGDKDAFAVDGHAAIDHVTAGVHALACGHLRVVLPYQLAAARVERIHHAPRAADVQAAIDHDGRGLHPAWAIETEVPGQAQAGHIAGIDGAQRAEAGFGGIEAMLSPLGGRAGRC